MTGIYTITHKRTGKAYVGQSTRLECRFNEHLYQSNRGSLMVIHCALRKYGKKAFRFEILELCETSELCGREKFHIARLNCIGEGYNIAIHPLSPNRGRKLPSVALSNRTRVVSADTRRKMAVKASQRRWSKKSRDKISAIKSGVKVSRAHREKLLAFARSRQKPIIQYHKFGHIVGRFDSAHQAARTLVYISAHAIRCALKGRSKTGGGYIWKYADQQNDTSKTNHE